MGGATDTIAAIASAPGQGGIGIVRMSGEGARRLGEEIAGRPLKPRVAHYAAFRDAQGAVIDHGIALLFAAPASFNGEDVVELQGHGGVVVMQLVLQAALDRGARMARPGEFTERAFANGKLDLAQAEAVADLIGSSSEAAARGALRSLRGEFSKRVHGIDRAVLELRVHVEAAIDFPEEEVELLADADVGGRLAALQEQLTDLLGASRRGALLREGITVALLGAPNVGKSSVLNALAEEERAIVTEVPGTTRDLVRAPVVVGGLTVTVVDTAGLRETNDVVEREGVRRAREQARSADVVLLVEDASSDVQGPGAQQLAPGAAILHVDNKVDLTNLSAGRWGVDRVRVSALTGAGIEELRRALLESVGYAESAGAFTARQRHLEALNRALQAVAAAIDLVQRRQPGELVAEELRRVHGELGEIVGETTSDELLGEIFSSFCIGK